MMTIYLTFNKTAFKSLLVLALFGILSCTDNFDEINTSKDEIVASKVDLSLLGQEFAYAQYYGFFGSGVYQIAQNLYADLYAQFFATTHPRFNSDQYLEVGGWTNGTWDFFYSKPAPQLLFVENFTKENDMPLANAIAKVWKVMIYHRMTDYFGPIIYSQFGNKKTSVPYDSQEDIYHSFFLTLDSAAQVLKQNEGGNAFGGNDQIYDGNADQWYLLANSLRLRLAMRLAYVEPDLAKREAEKAVKAGVIESNENSATMLSTPNSMNLLSRITYIYEFTMSATMESVLKGYDDPRLPIYFAEAIDVGGYHGLRNGLPAGEKNSTLNGTHSFVSSLYTAGPGDRGGTTTRNLVLTAAEVAFLRAEGALRGWDMGGTPKEFYNMGITLSLSDFRTKATPDVIAAYINSTNTPVAIDDQWNTPAMSDIPVKFDESGDFERKLEQIITQKWIALYPDGWEAWSERRRTGYPKGYPIINSLNPDIPVDGMMRRLMFTTGEIANNKAAVEEARSLLNGPDNNSTKLWWDAK